MNPTEVAPWFALAFGVLFLVALPPLLWQKFWQLREERRGFQEQMRGYRESQARNRRMERLCALDHKLSIRWHRRVERERKERDEKGYD